MATVVLQIETSAGVKTDVPLQPGANEILAEPGSRYRLMAADSETEGSPWSPQAFREGDDLIVQGATEDQSLVLEAFFVVCTDLQTCQLEIVSSSGLASSLTGDVQTIETTSTGRELVFDAALVHPVSSDGGLSWSKGLLLGGASIGLLAAAGGGGDSGGDPAPPIETPTVDGPGPIRLTGGKIQSIEIEGGDQVITDSEAGPQDRLVLTVTVNDPLSDVLNIDLFWDGPSGVRTQISNSDFFAEPEESTNTFRITVNVYERQNGPTVETGSGLTELDVVLYSEDPAGGVPLDIWQASIPLQLSFGTASGSQSTASVNPSDDSGDQSISVISYADVLSESPLFPAGLATGTDEPLEATVTGFATGGVGIVAVGTHLDHLAEPGLPSQL